VVKLEKGYQRPYEKFDIGWEPFVDPPPVQVQCGQPLAAMPPQGLLSASLVPPVQSQLDLQLKASVSSPKVALLSSFSSEGSGEEYHEQIELAGYDEHWLRGLQGVYPSDSWAL
jgi:hypothetical protein